MEVRKLHLVSAGLYLWALLVIFMLWFLSGLEIALKVGPWSLIPVGVVGIVLNDQRKKAGFTLHEILVTDPVIRGNASYVLAPGDYDFKIEESVNQYSGRKRYVVLVRPLGKNGFTFIKSACLVEPHYGTLLQEQLLDLHIVSPAAVKAVVEMMKKEVRSARSDFWHVEYSEKKIKEYEELFLS